MVRAKKITIRPWAFWTIFGTGLAVLGFVSFVTFRDDLVELHPWLSEAATMSGGLWVMFSLVVMCVQEKLFSSRRENGT